MQKQIESSARKKSMTVLYFMHICYFDIKCSVYINSNVNQAHKISDTILHKKVFIVMNLTLQPSLVLLKWVHGALSVHTNSFSHPCLVDMFYAMKHTWPLQNGWHFYTCTCCCLPMNFNVFKIKFICKLVTKMKMQLSWKKQEQKKRKGNMINDHLLLEYVF